MAPDDCSAERGLTAYWDAKFAHDGKVWGGEPSLAAVRTVDLLQSRAAGFPQLSLLDIGAGYGRDVAFFRTHGIDAEGIDISEEAVRIARSDGLPIQQGSLLDMSFADESFDVVFGNFILHLLPEADRRRALAGCLRVLKPGGRVLISVASTEDADCGVGEKVGVNLYRNSRGVIKFYYDQSAAQEDFSSFESVDLESFTERHTHGGEHVHTSYLICGTKTAVTS